MVLPIRCHSDDGVFEFYHTALVDKHRTEFLVEVGIIKPHSLPTPHGDYAAVAVLEFLDGRNTRNLLIYLAAFVLVVGHVQSLSVSCCHQSVVQLTDVVACLPETVGVCFHSMLLETDSVEANDGVASHPHQSSAVFQNVEDGVVP